MKSFSTFKQDITSDSSKQSPTFKMNTLFDLKLSYTNLVVNEVVCSSYLYFVIVNSRKRFAFAVNGMLNKKDAFVDVEQYMGFAFSLMTVLKTICSKEEWNNAWCYLIGVSKCWKQINSDFRTKVCFMRSWTSLDAWLVMRALVLSDCVEWNHILNSKI